MLVAAFRELKSGKAPGIDGVTKDEYGEEIDRNTAGLVDRLRRDAYHPQPSQRREIPKGNGKTRALGLPTFEDKLVQRGLTKILERVYEEDFLDFSYGFRARYTHRVAIANHRIQEIGPQQVRFHWRDYRDGRTKVLSLDGVEFLRRFAMHILPKGLVRIRHYGLLAGAKRRENLAIARALLPEEAGPGIEAEPSTKKPDGEESGLETPGVVGCPACGAVASITVTVIARVPAPTRLSTLWWDSS